MKISNLLKTTVFSAFLISSTLLNVYTIRLLFKEQACKKAAPSKESAAPVPFPASAAAAERTMAYTKTVTPILYRTKNGEKYHYDPHCSNNEYFQCTWQDVRSLGLTPCKRCVK